MCAKILQKIMAAPPLSVIEIVKYWRGGGGIGGRQNLTNIMTPPLSVIKMVKYCDVWGGRGHWGAPKSYKK